jgi:hypothetical protein
MNDTARKAAISRTVRVTRFFCACPDELIARESLVI